MKNKEKTFSNSKSKIIFQIIGVPIVIAIFAFYFISKFSDRSELMQSGLPVIGFTIVALIFILYLFYLVTLVFKNIPKLTIGNDSIEFNTLLKKTNIKFSEIKEVFYESKYSMTYIHFKVNINGISADLKEYNFNLYFINLDRTELSKMIKDAVGILPRFKDRE